MSKLAGSILEAQAYLQTAQINLSFTDITSPISFKIGRTTITRGTLSVPKQHADDDRKSGSHVRDIPSQPT